MTQSEFEQYWVPARRALNKGSEIHALEGSFQLAALLEVTYSAMGYWDRVILTPDLRWKLQLLAGPHGHTVLKMMEVRKE